MRVTYQRRAASEPLVASSDASATGGSRHRPDRKSRSDAYLFCLLRREKETARSLDSLWIIVACFYSFCFARLLCDKLLVPHHTPGALWIHLKEEIKIKANFCLVAAISFEGSGTKKCSGISISIRLSAQPRISAHPETRKSPGLPTSNKCRPPPIKCTREIRVLIIAVFL